MATRLGMILLRTAMASASFTALSVALPTAAQAQALKSFDIPPQSLASALIQFGNQSDESVEVPADLDPSVQTKGVRGSLSPVRALERLIKETGYDLLRSANRRLAITRSRPVASDDADSRDATPEVLVVGTRSLNVDIARTESDVQPYVVFDSKEIVQSQAATIGEFLKNRLPSNTISTTGAQQASAASNRSTIDLRGLGANQTLILVDGRRRASSIAAGGSLLDFQQPDLNGIPIAAIERIEVLPAGAGGIYGGGATAGVVNVILKHNYTGLTAGFTYDDTDDFVAGSRRYELNGAFPIGKSTRVSFSASHVNGNPLLIGERDFATRGRALRIANDPQRILSGLPPLGSTPNIRSNARSRQTGQLVPLRLRDGTPLNSTITFVPAGYAGAASDGGAGLVANAGKYNFALPNDARGLQQSLLSAPTVTSFNASVRRDFGKRLRGFVDLNYATNRGAAIFDAAPFNLQIAPGEVGNPFDNAISVTFPTPNVIRPSRGTSGTLGATGGLIFRVAKGWSAAIDHAWSRARRSGYSAAPSFLPAAPALFAMVHPTYCATSICFLSISVPTSSDIRACVRRLT